MDSAQLISILVMTLTLSMSMCHALPFNSVPWLERQPSASSERSEESYGPAEQQFYAPRDLNRIRQLVALKLLGQTPLSSYSLDKASSKGRPHQMPSKRLDFAFAGLDNMDHILTTLDRKEAIKSGAASKFFKNMQSHGYRGANSVDKITKLMENVG